ncbi:unnamed protein product [Effrenium voratum]|uniref:Uncharacterized protein n=1 Tax=Effrenium voratum TaxID=2562239 RepID=A0AA36MPK4_9DINO|nr:unnamed protein product [Effrenium voratum]CAJ1422224.1 unnamed protein product [Effrenium voratum]
MLQPWRQPGASHIAPRCTWQAQSKLPQMTRASKGALLAALSRCFPVRPREPRQMACRAFEQRTICGTETAPHGPDDRFWDQTNDEFAAADVALSGQKPPEAFVDVASSTGLKNSGKNVNQGQRSLQLHETFHTHEAPVRPYAVTSWSTSWTTTTTSPSTSSTSTSSSNTCTTS